MRGILVLAILLTCLSQALPAAAQAPAENLEKARAVFEELLAQTPDDPDIYLYLAEIAAATHETEKATGYFEEYAKRRPDDYLPRYRLGEYARDAGKKDAMQQHFEAALPLIDPARADLSAKLARARMLALTGDILASDEAFALLLEEAPGNADVLATHANTLLDLSRSKEALAIAEGYASRLPEDESLQRALSRAERDLRKYEAAAGHLAPLYEKHPDDASLLSDYAFLLYDMGDWQRAIPLFDRLGDLSPENVGINNAREELYRQSRPRISFGGSVRMTGSERAMGPYVRYLQPLTPQWALEAGYVLDRDSGNVVGFDPNFSTWTNAFAVGVRYKPRRTIELSAALENQLLGRSYSPSPKASLRWEHPIAGRVGLSFVYNQLFDNPTPALYFNGRQDQATFDYEKVFFERAILTLGYQSTWYRVDGAKTGTGGGNAFGRDDWGTGVLQFILHRQRPQLRIGYGLIASILHVSNNYLNVIPLVQRSLFSSARVGISQEWNRWLTTDLAGFVGADPKRGISFPDLYGVEFYNRLRLSKRVEFSAGYEYSSETISNTAGRYQFFTLECRTWF